MGSSSVKGSIPAFISKIRIPRVHQSTGFPCPAIKGTLVEQDFGGQVLGGAAEGVGSALDDLREAEIGEFDEAIRSN